MALLKSQLKMARNPTLLGSATACTRKNNECQSDHHRNRVYFMGRFFTFLRL